MPYRTTSPPVAQRLSLRWLRRAWCVFSGHRWKVLRERGSLALVHLHPYARCDAVCLRCGREWLDYE
jgi:hypothetical protein